MPKNTLNVKLSRFRPKHTPREELLNSLTHGLGALMSVAGMVVLVVVAALQGDPWRVVAVSVYGTTLVVLYLSSTLYHSVRRPRLKYLYEILDHAAIYLLIAGSYTPFLLISLRHSMGWMLLGIVWGLALIGIALKPFFVHRFRRLSPLAYLALSWLSVVAIPDMLANVPLVALVLIAAGGISYSVGVIFYAWSKLPFNHAIWHVFVLGGSICHYFAVLKIVLPSSQ